MNPVTHNEVIWAVVAIGITLLFVVQFYYYRRRIHRDFIATKIAGVDDRVARHASLNEAQHGEMQRVLVSLAESSKLGVTRLDDLKKSIETGFNYVNKDSVGLAKQVAHIEGKLDIRHPENGGGVHNEGG